jgi:hypothetical protein
MKNFIDYYLEATGKNPISAEDKQSKVLISKMDNIRKFVNEKEQEKWLKEVSKQKNQKIWINTHHMQKMQPNFWKSYSEFNKSSLEANTGGGEGLGWKITGEALKNIIKKLSEGEIYKLSMPMQSEAKKDIFYIFKGTMGELSMKLKKEMSNE